MERTEVGFPSDNGQCVPGAGGLPAPRRLSRGRLRLTANRARSRPRPAGDRAQAQAAVAELERERRGRALFGYELALVHLALGETEAALVELKRARNDRSGWMAYLACDPRLDPLRSEPRFAALSR